MRRRRSRSRGTADGLSRRHVLLLLAGGSVGAGALYSVGAFTTTASDRSSTVNVSSDDTAYLGISYEDQTASSGSTITLLNLTNRFDQPLDTIDVTVVNAGQIAVSNVQTPNSLNSGESGEITADISCDSTVTEPVEVKIVVRSSDLSTAALRSSDLTCTALDPYDCHDIWEMACDYNEGGTLQLDNQTRDGSVCMDDSGDVKIEMQHASRIEGFARMLSGHNGTVRLQDDSIIDGACAVKGCENVTAQLQGTGDGTGSEIKGDLCIRAGGDGTVQLQDGSVIGGDLKIDADGNTEVQLQSGSSVAGTIDENWNSGWQNEYCSP